MSTHADDVFGVWRLVSARYHTDAGDEIRPFGPTPCGTIMYCRDGAMTATLLAGGPAEGAPERASEQGPVISYFGTVTLDAQARRLTHHIQRSTIAAWEGVRQERRYAVDGEFLTLSHDPIPMGGSAVASVSVWKRVR